MAIPSNRFESPEVEKAFLRATTPTLISRFGFYSNSPKVAAKMLEAELEPGETIEHVALSKAAYRPGSFPNSQLVICTDRRMVIAQLPRPVVS